ncbi:GIP [Symbiodinium natans]|uniref:GIP protein n=1 Tax=Symbiodinium natans TaxID=878477 RepID=A0A812SXZ4_9DINO|nr:GIP [Symbiodinium natans]
MLGTDLALGSTPVATDDLCCHFSGRRSGCCHRSVKPDKRQRESMEGLSSRELLEMLLTQLSRRAACAGLAFESFGIQQELHQALANSTREDASLKPAQQRNLLKLVSRMSWCQFLQFAKTNCNGDPSFLDSFQRRVASLRHGVIPDEQTRMQQQCCISEPFWLSSRKAEKGQHRLTNAEVPKRQNTGRNIVNQRDDCGTREHFGHSTLAISASNGGKSEYKSESGLSRARIGGTGASLADGRVLDKGCHRLLGGMPEDGNMTELCTAELILDMLVACASSRELLEMLLTQLSRRAACAGLAFESFGIQQELHQALANSTREDASLKPAQQRNLLKLVSRMSWCQFLQFAKTNCNSDPSFLDSFQRRVASLRHGVIPDEQTRGPSFWL